jgi:DNA-binding XRE family transcriptional regulator
MTLSGAGVHFEAPGDAGRPKIGLLRFFYKWTEAPRGSVAWMPRADYEDPPPRLRALGAALRELREREGLKQIELATAAGMTESQVSDIERGKNNPGWLLVARMVEDGLGLGMGELARAYERALAEQG